MDPTVQALLTAVGLAPVATFVTGAILGALALTAERRDQVGPIVGLVTGIALGAAAAFILGTNPGIGALTGLLSGAGGIATHSVIRGVTTPS